MSFESPLGVWSMPIAHEAATRLESIDAYQQAVNASFVPLRIRSASRSAFSGSVSSVSADDVVFTEVGSTPQQVDRTPDTIESGGSGYYKVSLLLSGSSILIQDGREITMRPGDLAFYDTSRPYSLLFDSNFRNLIMMFPKNRIEFPAQLSDSLTAVSLGTEHELAGVITSFISRAAPQLTNLPFPARTRLARTSLDLMNTMLSAILDTDAEQREPRTHLLQSIYNYINANLASPALSPGSIAAANFISVRHLHSLFRDEGTTVSRWIKEHRLERCRSDLHDPAYAHLAISAIASRWGFVDAGHFSRAFRAAYGLSPREFRRGAC